MTCELLDNTKSNTPASANDENVLGRHYTEFEAILPCLLYSVDQSHDPGVLSTISRTLLSIDLQGAG